MRRTPGRDDGPLENPVEEGDDPRLDGDYVRRAGDGVVLVGVVHDHPASRFRARTVVERVDPRTLALELPPLAVPLFGTYAEDTRTPPAFGGEMSAAIQAAPEATVAGIDGPSATFLRELVVSAVRERPSSSALSGVLDGLASVTREAVACRLAAAVADLTSLRVEVGSPVEHDCDPTDPPAVQAEDERRQVALCRSVLGALDRPSSVAFRDAVRDRSMARRLRAVAEEGPVVAVVGVHHLDPLAERLSHESAGVGGDGTTVQSNERQDHSNGSAASDTPVRRE